MSTAYSQGPDTIDSPIRLALTQYAVLSSPVAEHSRLKWLAAACVRRQTCVHIAVRFRGIRAPRSQAFARRLQQSGYFLIRAGVS